ncbi:hypothetical protein [Parafrankia discariae]|uniref:hypothetical protein n=1 Tax=Parafrankia discariae TaxID=365528 RepID=UPI0004784968|nr:hypothetical protein [Parafrankia discariae]
MPVLAGGVRRVPVPADVVGLGLGARLVPGDGERLGPPLPAAGVPGRPGAVVGWSHPVGQDGPDDPGRVGTVGTEVVRGPPEPDAPPEPPRVAGTGQPAPVPVPELVPDPPTPVAVAGSVSGSGPAATGEEPPVAGDGVGAGSFTTRPEASGVSGLAGGAVVAESAGLERRTATALSARTTVTPAAVTIPARRRS